LNLPVNNYEIGLINDFNEYSGRLPLRVISKKFSRHSKTS